MNRVITIVSGLPRSGTSMMMQMLDAGGMQIVTDHIREADEDNPRGYYEFERVKKIKEDTSWLEACRGKAFKMVSALLEHLPGNERYKVLFMQREMDEVLASQRVMLERQGKAVDAASDEKMARNFEIHLEKVMNWLNGQSHIDVMYLQYDAILADPRDHALRVNAFLGGLLDAEKMDGVVEPSLHRQRKN